MRASDKSFILTICIAFAIGFAGMTATIVSATDSIEMTTVGSVTAARSDTESSLATSSALIVETGPRRDDPGDVIAEFEAPYEWTSGLAWDTENDWIWGLDYIANRLYAINPENGEVVVNFAIEGNNRIGLFYLDDMLWVGGFNTRRTIFRYDREGNQL